MPFLILLLCAHFVYAAAPAQKAVVVVPVTDVWSRPLKPNEKASDDLRETQVLYGEQVSVHEIRGQWASIEALDQPAYRPHQKWEGYPGWISIEALKMGLPSKETQDVLISSWTSATEPETVPDVWLPLGGFLRPAGTANDWFVVSTPLGDRCLDIGNTALLPRPSRIGIGDKILGIARKMMGVAYLWGGLTIGNSPPQKLVNSNLTYGVDCSGLVHLSYRANGITVPRDSYDQWMQAKPIKRRELKPADLIFSAKIEHPKKVTHVALYTGYDQIIEAPQTGMIVRQVTFEEKYGKPLNQVESGDTVGERVIYFGTFLH